MMTPAQKRKMSEAQAESQKHARYAQADGSMKKGDTNSGYNVSPAIESAGKRVNAATAKEKASIGPSGPSYDDRY